MSGEDKAREVARELWWPHHASRTRAVALADLDDGNIGAVTLEFEDVANIVAVAWNAALDEATGVAREWGGQNADGWSWVTGTRDSIATSIEALKDQK